MVFTVALVSCVKSKKLTPSPARDLYTSALFQGMRRYAEHAADRWYILSAEHGLLRPDERVKPYERTLKRMPKVDRDQWGRNVTTQLGRVLKPGARVILLAGARYREQVTPYLEENGIPFVVPMQGLRLGAQLRWLNEHAEC